MYASQFSTISWEEFQLTHLTMNHFWLQMPLGVCLIEIGSRMIYLGVANGTQSRALLYNNITYAPSASRPLISIGQLKAMLDLRFVWDDGPPSLLFCSSGQTYVLIRAKVFHGLPIISQKKLKKSVELL